MGYFSNLMIDWEEVFSDHSYTPPEKVLEWRIDDLLDRKAELEAEGAYVTSCGGARLYGDDLKYCLPSCFFTLNDIETAIALAQEALVALRGYEYNYEVEIPLDTFMGFVAAIKPSVEPMPEQVQWELLAA